MALKDFRRRSLHDDFAAVHHDRTVCKQRLFHEVCDEENCDPFLFVEAFYDLDDFTSTAGIKHRRRLV